MIDQLVATVDAEVEGGSEKGHPDRRPFCPVLVEGERYTFDHSPITGGEIMDAAGIPHSAGLIQILSDGSQRQFGVDEEIELPHRGEEPCGRFVKRVRFQRG